MLKMTDRILTVAEKVNEFKLNVSELNGTPILLIGHERLGDGYYVMHLSSEKPIRVFDHQFRINNEGRLIADLLLEPYYDDEDDEEVREEVDITEAVKKTYSLNLDLPCFEHFMGALAHPEWHEQYMSHQMYMFLKYVYADDIARMDSFEEEEE